MHGQQHIKKCVYFSSVLVDSLMMTVVWNRNMQLLSALNKQLCLDCNYCTFDCTEKTTRLNCLKTEWPLFSIHQSTVRECRSILAVVNCDRDVSVNTFLSSLAFLYHFISWVSVPSDVPKWRTLWLTVRLMFTHPSIAIKIASRFYIINFSTKFQLVAPQLWHSSPFTGPVLTFCILHLPTYMFLT